LCILSYYVISIRSLISPAKERSNIFSKPRHSRLRSLRTTEILLRTRRYEFCFFRFVWFDSFLLGYSFCEEIFVASRSRSEQYFSFSQPPRSLNTHAHFRNVASMTYTISHVQVSLKCMTVKWTDRPYSVCMRMEAKGKYFVSSIRCSPLRRGCSHQQLIRMLVLSKLSGCFLPRRLRHRYAPNNESPKFLWQWATPVFVVWFVGSTWKHNSKFYI
jgi:hypothetical protein